MVKRKRNRLEGYDYSQNGAYFVTICVEDMKQILLEVVRATVLGRLKPCVKLSSVGEKIKNTIENNSHK